MTLIQLLLTDGSDNTLSSLFDKVRIRVDPTDLNASITRYVASRINESGDYALVTCEVSDKSVNINICEAGDTDVIFLKYRWIRV
jgi:hypothetical protein